jgi:hypothetical protein
LQTVNLYRDCQRENDQLDEEKPRRDKKTGLEAAPQFRNREGGISNLISPPLMDNRICVRIVPKCFT